MPRVTPNPNDALYAAISAAKTAAAALSQPQTITIQDPTRNPPSVSGGSQSQANTAVITGQLPNNLPTEAPPYPNFPGQGGQAHWNGPARPLYGHMVIADDGSPSFEANQNDLVSPNRFTFTFAGALPSSTGLSGQHPTQALQSGYIFRAIATVGTLDASNPVEVGLYANGSQYATLMVPTQNTWSSATPYLVGDMVQGATGYAALCVSAGTSGGSSPSFSSTPGNITTDGGAAWQTVSLSHSSLAGGPGTFTLPGNGDDNLQTMINSYGGSTAADLVVNVRTR